jgi:hypothetical protein
MIQVRLITSQNKPMRQPIQSAQSATEHGTTPINLPKPYKNPTDTVILNSSSLNPVGLQC